MGVYIEKEWLAKRVIKNKLATYSGNKNFKKSSYSYRNNSVNRPVKNSSEVMVKITSSGKNLKGIKAHMDYISRNGDLPLEDEQGLIYHGRDEVRELRDYLRDNGVKIKKKGESKREYRQTMNIVFSMRDHKEVSEEKIKKAVKATLKKLYPDNMYVMAYHGDTDNPHCHVILKIADNNNNRININLYDLQEIRTQFAKYLNALNVAKAKATPFKKSVNKLPSRAVEIVDFGKDFYQHKSENKLNYFVTYKNQNGKNITIWSKYLEDSLSSSGVKRGDKVALKVSHIEKVSLPRFMNKNSELSNEIILNKKHWKVDVIERYQGKNYRADPAFEYQRAKRLMAIERVNKQEITLPESSNLSAKLRYDEIRRKLVNERNRDITDIQHGKSR